MRLTQRFKIVEHRNPGGSISFRVTGTDRRRRQIRQNFARIEDARARQIELETDFLGRATETAMRLTRLTPEQVATAEAVFFRLDRDEDLPRAVDFWLKHGAPTTGIEVRLEAAVADFRKWLEKSSLRPKSRVNLASRLNVFLSLAGDVCLSDITPAFVEAYLDKRNVSPASRDNDRRVLSRFFNWCVQRPRHWMHSNPAREIRVEMPRNGEPAVLPLPQVEALLRASQAWKKGKHLPFVVLSLYAGMRPAEIERLKWPQVNFGDGEIRLRAEQAKTGRSRVIGFNPALKAWLAACKGKPICPGDWDNCFRAMRRDAGIHEWPADVLRHTAISHFFRDCGSYGLTAEWAGNSEQIIREHYQGRVSSDDTKAFYALRPERRSGGGDA